jgi:hypothetical protein
MRQMSDAFAARLAAAETSLCLCWRFERADGEVFGATDHDVALAFEGVTYAPAAGLADVAFTSTSGLAPGHAAASGALSLDYISEAALDDGLWDRARVDVWQVDWQAAEHRVLVWSGRLSGVSRQGQAYVAELVSLKADLERMIGRVYSRQCDAQLGDARCGVDLDDPELIASGAVAAGCDKSFATCGARFGNRVNFRGFPHMPGVDAVLAGPASDRPNSGGRRA